VDAGLVGLALTDHDTVAGCPEAAAEAARLGVRFLPGIEISAEFPRPGTLHLLGYGVDPASASLRSLTHRLISGRGERNEKIIAAMTREGFAVTLDEFHAEAAGGTIGRPHLAGILVRKGYVKTRQEAFDRYLGQGGAFYFDKETTTARDAIAVVHDAEGVAVLAHPTQLRCSNTAHLETTIKSLVDQGLDGIEVFHPDHGARDVETFAGYASRWGLLATGGSDFHGAAKPQIILGQAGKNRVPEEVMDAVVSAIARRPAN
jgi:predicted metal-dependent phosphoesterase TrpH